METLVNNRLVNIWRGSDKPPTIHHVWIKDDTSLFLYDLDVLEWVTFMDYPGTKVTLLDDGSVKVSVGDTYFILATSGSSLAMNKVGNTIMFVSNALSSIPTSSPLEWKNQELKHLDSGVEAGDYGPKLNNSSNSFTVPNFTVNQTGHITKASLISVSIPDRVVLNPLNSEEGKYPIILAGSNSSDKETGEVNKNNNLYYDAENDKVHTPGLIIDGISTFNGVTTFNANIKLGSNAVIEGSVTGTATPTNHASETDVFGVGTFLEASFKPAMYGHVKLKDVFEVLNGFIIEPTKEQGEAATPSLVFQAYQAVVNLIDDRFGSDFVKGSDGKFNIDWYEF